MHQYQEATAATTTKVYFFLQFFLRFLFVAVDVFDLIFDMQTNTF